MLKKSNFCQFLVEIFQFLANFKQAAVFQFRKDQTMKQRQDFFKN